MKRSAILKTVIGISLLSIGMFLIWKQGHREQSPGDEQTGSVVNGPSRHTGADHAEPEVTDTASGQGSLPSVDFPSNLSSVLSTAVGIGGQKDFGSRLEAISELGTNLSTGEIQALYIYLSAPREDERWLRPGQSYALKNDVMNVLREQETPPDDLTDLLVDLWRDETQPLVIRDYSLQHLAPWYSEVPAEQKERIARELSEAAEEVDRSFAGTALIALVRIQNENPGIELASFAHQIKRLVQDENADLLARISAVQLVGELDIAEMHDRIRELAMNESQPKTLRLAAVASLRHIAGEEVILDLEKLARGSDSRLAHAASSALKKYQSEVKEPTQSL